MHGQNDWKRELLAQLVKMRIQILGNKEHKTIEELWYIYFYSHVKPNCKTARRMKYLFDNYCTPLRKRIASEVTPFEIKSFHEKITKRGKIIANKVLEVLRQTYKYAIDWRFHRGDNPAVVVKMNPKKIRTRFLEKDEVPRLYRALEKKASRKMHDFFLCCLYTGQRLSTVASMRWEEVSLSRGVWYIPSTAPGNKAKEDWQQATRGASRDRAVHISV